MNDVFGKKLGKYILLEQLGEGGMAKVYNALDSRAESNVAIKVIIPSKRNSQVFLQQFEQEAKTLANLTHTNIVKVLNYGVEDGQPYLVMEYIAGGTLKEAMGQKLPWQIAAATLAPIAWALDYVHQQQIVHRDVKPANILLQEDFRPMLSDFGILKLLESKDEKVDSAIGSGVGTPEYMPPEQGMGKEVDFRADIYSLGIVFYEMVTGQKAFTADTPMAIVLKHITDEVTLPSSIDRTIPKYVERAILRAVEKNPEDRYLSMGHFAEVLELIALGDKTPTKEITRISMQKAGGKKTFPVALISALFLIIVGVSFFTYNYFGSLNSRLTEAPILIPSNNTEKTATPQPTTFVKATQTPISTPITVEAQTIGTDLVPLAGMSLLGTPFPQIQSSNFGEIARWGIGGVNVVDWSPDGKAVALGTTSGIFIYNATSRELILFINTGFDVIAMSYSPNPNEIAAGSPGGKVITLNGQTGEVLQTYNYLKPVSNRIDMPQIGAVSAISYSPSGKNFAVGYTNGVINYFSTEQNSAKAAFDEINSVEDVVISGDGSLIYASDGTGKVSIWNIPTQSKGNRSLEASASSVSKLSISKQGGQFLLGIGANGNSVQLWDLHESRLVKSFSNVGGKATAIDFSHDNKYIAIGLDSGVTKIFEMPDAANYSTTRPPIATTLSMGGQIRSVAFSPNQTILAAGNWDGGADLWDAQKGENIASLADGISSIERIYFSHDGSWLATSHTDGYVRIWDVNSAQQAYPPLPGYLPKGIPFSPDNQYLAIVHSTGKNQADAIQIVELKTSKIITELPDPDITKKTFVQFTDDNKRLVAGTVNTASVWDVSTWERINSHGGFNAGCGQYRIPPPYPLKDNLLAVISDGGILFSYEPKIQAMCGFGITGGTPMYYFQTQNQMVFVLGDGKVWVGNNESSDISSKKFNEPYKTPDQIFLAAEQSGWYAYMVGGNLKISNLGGLPEATINGQDDYEYRVAFLPGKKLVALGSKYGSIHFLTMP